MYYVQYAHARSCNVDRNAEAAQINAADADLSLLDTEADGEVIAALAQWPALLTLAGDLRAPHRIPEPARAAARLKLNDAVQTVIAEGLDLLGVTAPDKM